MEQIATLAYTAIQITSHQFETGYYRPSFGHGFSWQRQGPGGDCVCPKCGYRIKHQGGVPCSSLQCPSCKINLERK